MDCREWKEVKLNEIGVIKGRIGWKGYKTSDLRDDGPLVLGGNNIKNSIYLDLSDLKHLSREKFEESPEIRLCKNDILIVTRGNGIGDVSFFNGEIDEATINPSLIILKECTENAKFIYYYLVSPKGRSDILSISSGSSIPAIYQKSLSDLKLTIPPKVEQKAIAHILSTLDEKIETNNRINHVLEEMAQLLFKRWFVDFEFPNEDGEPYKSSGGEMVESEFGLIPKGWEVRSLDEIAVYTNGLAMQNFPPEINDEELYVLKIKELRQGFVDENCDFCSSKIEERYIVNDGDLIFSWSGSLLLDVWCGGRCGLNQHLFKVTSNEYSQWFYHFWTQYHLEKFIEIAKSKATTMGHIKRKDLHDSLVVIPDKDNLKKTEVIIKPIYEALTHYKIESRKLVSVRDTLLPKLMSGEIRVPCEEELSEIANSQ